MRILIVGNGGREHALLWKLRRDAPDARFWATRPNGGMRPLCEPVEIAPTDVEALAGWADAHRIDLTVVGPEAPLAAGIVDRLEKAGLLAFGPTRQAARIESSKAFAKELMVGAGVPTAGFRTFTSMEGADGAEAYLRERGAPIVVKASGLAAGKGAVVCGSVDGAVEAARSMLDEHAFGRAGAEIVVEDYMEGEELSLFGVCDGDGVALLLPSQDHKRVGEGDTGPNTGGMGAYAPVSVATPELLAEARDRVFLPTLRALAERGAPFRGLLYAGLMRTGEGLKVVEFNCRFGDPETQVVLPLLRTSLLELMMAAAEGSGIDRQPIAWADGVALTTVLASDGYPGDYPSGRPIQLPADLEDRDDVLLFHAGTRREGTRGRPASERLVTAGGRVLACTGLGPTLEVAAERSRAAAERIAFEGRQYRSDIGWRELERTAAAR